MTSDSLEESQARLDDIRQAAGLQENYEDDGIILVPSHGEGVRKELLLSPTPAVRHILTSSRQVARRGGTVQR